LRERKIDGIDLVTCSEILCQLPEAVRPFDSRDHRVYIEADGELLGCLPARLTMQPDALSLIVPGAKN